MRFAVVDLGTNTFHLLIVEVILEQVHVLFKAHLPAKIGKAGINEGIIAPDAVERAVAILTQYRQQIEQYQVAPQHVKTIGTSAIRNASNQAAFCDTIFEQTGFAIEVISGEREAELIYGGVQQALDLGQAPSLIMDIGGGSVEFIIANAERIFWKQSFEIGGQRLIEKFMTTDPISPQAVACMNAYFCEQLLPLHNAVHQYAPQTLVGSSGAFDTLIDIDFMHRLGQLPPSTQTGFVLDLTEFQRQYQVLISRNRAERMAVAGMIELRVEMIVVGVVLINYVLQSFDIQQLRCSTYALKEGILNWVLKSLP
jgi:exopolyphosphatase / guanosine-5'-triphosphate,3'-diphosphate pyrophosphatase